MIAGPLLQFTLNMMQQSVHLSDMMSDRVTIALMLFGMHVLRRFKQRIGFFVRRLKARVVLVVIEHVEAQAIGFGFESPREIFTTCETAELQLNRLGDLNRMQLR